MMKRFNGHFGFSTVTKPKWRVTVQYVEIHTHWCVLDWFVTQELVEIGHDDEDYCNYNDLVEWRNDCKQRKV